MEKILHQPVVIGGFILSFIILSGCIAPRIDNIRILYYDKYDNDHIALSNPTNEFPIYPLIFNNTRKFETIVAVNVTSGGTPVFNTNVTLEIWNSTYKRRIMINTTRSGYATFSFLGDIPPPSDNYRYRAYLAENSAISTESREIRIQDSPVSSSDKNKTVTLEKAEVINSSGSRDLRVSYSVVAQQTMDDLYTIEIRDYFGNITFNNTRPVHLEPNIPVEIAEEIALNKDIQFENVNIKFILHDPVTVETSLVIFRGIDPASILGPGLGEGLSFPIVVLPGPGVTPGPGLPPITLPPVTAITTEFPPAMVSPGAIPITTPHPDPDIERQEPDFPVEVPETQTFFMVSLLSLLLMIYLVYANKK
jgi:hypothetical protein